jgi:Family of unknown function (DUF6312)
MQEAMMDDLVKRVTVIQRNGDDRQAVAVYEKPQKKRRKVSILARPFAKAAKRLVQAQVTFGQELIRRGEESNSRRRDGWLLEGPANAAQSGRKAYNVARKAVPFGLLPKV